MFEESVRIADVFAEGHRFEVWMDPAPEGFLGEITVVDPYEES